MLAARLSSQTPSPQTASLPPSPTPQSSQINTPRNSPKTRQPARAYQSLHIPFLHRQQNGWTGQPALGKGKSPHKARRSAGNPILEGERRKGKGAELSAGPTPDVAGRHVVCGTAAVQRRENRQTDRRTDSLFSFFCCLPCLPAPVPSVFCSCSFMPGCLVFALAVSGLLLRGGAWYDDDDDDGAGGVNSAECQVGCGKGELRSRARQGKGGLAGWSVSQVSQVSAADW